MVNGSNLWKTYLTASCLPFSISQMVMHLRLGRMTPLVASSTSGRIRRSACIPTTTSSAALRPSHSLNQVQLAFLLFFILCLSSSFVPPMLLLLLLLLLLSELSNALPGLEPNPEEAPYLKEAIMNALKIKKDAFRRRMCCPLCASSLPCSFVSERTMAAIEVI